ncbi:beta strand repeat-containing protein [Aeoliella sp. SH292]|uniref:beta strand repeat-containing protein n=1 Tax=Aeoliella sp. SH292 TaxID=3454464 RepID=UPI003F9A9C5C
MRSISQRAIFFCSVATTTLLLAGAAQAIDVNLTADNGLGTTSFNSALSWSNAAAPSAGNNYFNNNFLLRTPGDGNSYTFGGDSLTITSDSAPGVQLNDALMYKGTGATGTITVNNLTINGGNLRQAQGAADVFNLAGNSLTVGSLGMGVHVQGPLNLLSTLTGAGDITVVANGNADPLRTFHLKNSANTFTGNVLLPNATQSRFAVDEGANFLFDINAPGINNSISGAGVATFNGMFNFDLAGASSTPGDSWTLVSAAGATYGTTFSVGNGFTQSGSVWTNGTYTFTPSTGVLAVAAPPVEWNVDSDGLFGTASNWSNNAVPTAGSNVLFGGVITANRTVTLDSNVSANKITFANTGDGDYYVKPQAAQTITLTGEANIDTTGRHWISASIGGLSGLTKAGSGELILDAGNTFTGGLTVNAGRLSVTHPSAIPANQNVTLTAAGSNLLFGGNNGFFVDNGAIGGGYLGGTVNGVISGAGTVIVTLGATPTFTGDNTFAGTMVVEGTDTKLTLSGAGTPGLSDGTAASLTRVSGTAQLALVNKAVGNEVLYLDERVGTAPAHLTSSGSSSWAGNIKAETPLEGSNYKFESTSGTLTLSGTLSAFDAAAPNDRYFVFDGAGNTTITGRITDYATDANGNFVDVEMNGTPDTNAGRNVHVVKRGSGTLTIATSTSNSFDYWGASTVIEAGTLAVQASGGTDGELATSGIDVRSGATFNVSSFSQYTIQNDQALRGAGTVNTGAGNVRLFAGSNNVVAPGDSGVGTLTVNGNLELSNLGTGGVMQYELGNTTTVGGTESDLLSVSGAINASSGSPSVVVQVTPREGTLATGSYRLANHSGGAIDVSGMTGQAVNNLGETLNPRQTFTVTSAANQINLQVSGSASSLTWAGTAGNNIWNVANSSNWSGGNQFRDLDAVTFGASGEKNVVVNSHVTPGSTTFNSASTYTFSGTGGLAGYGAVNVSNGTVKLYNTGNDYRGTTTVASGATLEATAASTGSMVVNGTLSVGKPVTETLIDNFSGGLGSYTNTVILDTDINAGANVGTWQVSGGQLQYDTSTFQSIEQSVFVRSGMSLGVGEELQIDIAHTGASQDIGLYVGGTAPTAASVADNDTRQNFLNVYGRNATNVFSRGFVGATETTLTGGAIAQPAYDKLFIKRDGQDDYELGYYNGDTRVVVANRDNITLNDGSVVGFYTDVRAAGILGNLANLTVVSGGGVDTLDINGDFNLGSTGTLALDINGSGADRLDISGFATLTGEIAVTLATGFTPADGQQFTLLSAAGGIATALGSLDFGAGLPSGFTASYNDSMTDLILTFAAGLNGDFNGDGIVNLADYTVWRDNLGATEDDLLSGNGTGGVIDADDYALWKTNFGATSGAGALGGINVGQATVPEPSSVLLLLGLAAGGATLLRRRGIGQHSTV